jgi:hypothetical protein
MTQSQTPPLPPPLPTQPAAPLLSYASAPVRPSYAAWSDGPRLILTDYAELPDQCAKCGAPADGWRWTGKAAWHHPAFYLLLLVPVLGPPLYVVTALAVRKRIVVALPLCRHHRRARLIRQIASCLLAVLGAGVVAAGIWWSGQYRWAGDQGMVLCLIGAGLIVGAALVMYDARLLTVRHMAGGYGWFSGASPEFLALLDPTPDPSRPPPEPISA